ncbi:MAG: hypothetical protein M3N29_10855 [Chloroflexota bacterium]|nr:hypothetical protein [Chloroflexota bacterium]
MRGQRAPSWARATPWAPERRTAPTYYCLQRAGPRPTRLAASAGASLEALLLSPATASAHVISERYQAPLPLLAYVAGAALAVAMSFVFVNLRGRSRLPGTAGRIIRVAPVVQLLLRAIGLLAWLWIMGQAFLGGVDESADVAGLFLWVYGWVGIALLSALVGPIWSWLDPFSTLHIVLSGTARRLRLVGDEDEARPSPAGWGIWPAITGFVAVVWLELVGNAGGGRTLALLLLAYTLITLAGMSWFGREEWRRHGEIFSVWFRLLGRLAPLALAGPPEAGRIVRRPFGAGLFERRSSLAEVVLVTLGTAAIIFDGLSQTDIYAALFGRLDLPGLPPALINTLVMAGFFALVLAVVLGAARGLGSAAVGAGLLPVAVGYLVAHYFVTLLVDGQRILLALNDPLLQGTDLLPFPWSAWQPTLFIPTSLVWAIQLAAVVGGHVVGAWAGHAALDRAARRTSTVRQVTLAGLMVVLTSVTLWSLGQAVITEPAAAPAAGSTGPRAAPPP